MFLPSHFCTPSDFQHTRPWVSVSDLVLLLPVVRSSPFQVHILRFKIISHNPISHGLPLHSSPSFRSPLPLPLPTPPRADSPPPTLAAQQTPLRTLHSPAPIHHFPLPPLSDGGKTHSPPRKSGQLQLLLLFHSLSSPPPAATDASRYIIVSLSTPTPTPTSTRSDFRPLPRLLPTLLSLPVLSPTHAHPIRTRGFPYAARCRISHHNPL